ncbi:hypothetical protein KKD03_05095 [Patescibacteria group bacterium]|nr:hypothetical protein [Patescibacteria group bacterium]
MRKEIQKHDLIVVGTGPGGMSAAKAFSENNPTGKILMVESGNASKHRKCPVLFKEKQCFGCGGNCQIIEGVGGACSSVSCGMLSEFPAGTGQLEYWSKKELIALETLGMNWVHDINGEPLDRVIPNISSDLLSSATAQGMETKQYTSSEVEGAQFEKLMNALFADVVSSPNVETKFGQRVTDVREIHGRLSVITAKGDIFGADQVIFATGRAGNSKSTQILNNLGTQVNGASGYIGLRFEHLAHERLIQLRKNVLDPKFKRDGARMFCFCPEGKVVGMDVPNSVVSHLSINAISTADSLEGCVWPNSPFGNFSVQEAINFSSLTDLKEWEKEFFRKYIKLSDARLIGQSFQSLIDKTNPGGNNLTNKGSSIPKRWQVADIRQLIPHATIDKIINFIHDFNQIIGGGLVERGNPTIFAPELHIWPKFQLNKKMETTVSGLYVVGDMSGVARGILQAMNMGRVAGMSAAGVSLESLVPGVLH